MVSRGWRVEKRAVGCCVLDLGRRGGLGFRRCSLDFVGCCRIYRFLRQSSCRLPPAFVAVVCLARCALAVWAWDLIGGGVSGMSFSAVLGYDTRWRRLLRDFLRRSLLVFSSRSHSLRVSQFQLLVGLGIAFCASCAQCQGLHRLLDLVSQACHGCVLFVSSTCWLLSSGGSVTRSQLLAVRGSQLLPICLCVSIASVRDLHHLGKAPQKVYPALYPCCLPRSCLQGFLDDHKDPTSCLLRCHFGSR